MFHVVIYSTKAFLFKVPKNYKVITLVPISAFASRSKVVKLERKISLQSKYWHLCRSMRTSGQEFWKNCKKNLLFFKNWIFLSYNGWFNSKRTPQQPLICHVVLLFQLKGQGNHQLNFTHDLQCSLWWDPSIFSAWIIHQIWITCYLKDFDILKF